MTPSQHRRSEDEKMLQQRNDIYKAIREIILADIQIVPTNVVGLIQ
jgi:hypothetical protein